MERNVAIIVTDTLQVTSNNTGGFKFTIGGTEYGTSPKNSYIPCDTDDGFTYFKTSRNFANSKTYSGYVYILCPDQGTSFQKYVIVNDQDVLAAANFTKIGNAITTYSGNQTLYLYKSYSFYENVSSIRLVNN